MDDITAEYAAGALSSPVSLRTRVRATVAAKTDLGRVRENNEDKFEFYVPEDDTTLARRGAIYIVCDGMGGHAAGQIASELAAKTFIDVYLHHPAEDPAVGMLSGVQAANRFVTDIGLAMPSRRGMGTTFSGIVLLQEKLYTVQVGDSRIYRLRNGELLQLTFDHTYVDEMVRAGMLTAAEAETHPNKHVLARAIGGDMEVVPEIESHDLMEGDVFLLCSDGLTNHVNDQTLQDYLLAYSPSEACWKLVGQALLGGGSDNCTVMVVRVDEMSALD